MKQNQVLRYNMHFNKVEHGDQVIIANTSNGMNFKLTKECFEILDQCIGKKMTYANILSVFDEDEDKEYFNRVLTVLSDYQILVTKEERDPFLPYILLTNRCNLSCIHCCANASPFLDEDELTTEEWFEVADKMKGMDIVAICISGGEPLIRPDFFEIVRYFKNKLGVKISLMSNATLIDDKKAKTLMELFDGGFSFSIDGISEETCAMIRGKGTFAKTMRGIEIMKANGMKNYSLSFTSTRLNKQYEKEFEEFANRLGARPMIRHYDLAGRALDHKELIVEKDLTAYFCVPVLAGNEKGYHFEPNKLPMCISCGACNNRFSISSKGDIYPCQLLEYPEYLLASSKSLKSIKDFFEKEEYKNTVGYQNFIDLYAPKSEHCRDCVAKLHCNTCTYGSRLFRQMKNMDEMCKWKQKEWETIWN